MFRALMSPQPTHRILDLGGGDGSHLRGILPEHQNIVVADHWEPDLARARALYGAETVRLDGADGRLPFDDGAFDIVFCSSVIEHVTGPKEEMIALDDARIFAERAWEHQSAFAAEIRRVAKAYFVQTPHRAFPLEPHTLLPQPIIYLPRAAQRGILKAIAPVWPAKVQPDWRLLDETEMRALFPDAEVALEHWGGLVKSITAVRKPQPA
jgi:hypothetical protein